MKKQRGTKKSIKGKHGSPGCQDWGSWSTMQDSGQCFQCGWSIVQAPENGVPIPLEPWTLGMPDPQVQVGATQFQALLSAAGKLAGGGGLPLKQASNWK